MRRLLTILLLMPLFAHGQGYIKQRIKVSATTFGGQAPAYYLDRANHTGAQAQSTITGLRASLDSIGAVYGRVLLQGGDNRATADTAGTKSNQPVILIANGQVHYFFSNAGSDTAYFPQFINVAGAANTAAMRFIQQPFAGTSNTSIPSLFFGSGGSGYSTQGAFIGGNDTFSTSPDFFNFQVAGTSNFRVTNGGNLTNSGTIVCGGAITSGGGVIMSSSGGLTSSTRSTLISSQDGYWTMRNNAGTDFTQLNFGGTTSSFPSIRKSGTEIQFRLADQSAYVPIRASGAYLTNIVEYADNAAALTAGLTAGQLYRTGDALKIVH